MGLFIDWNQDALLPAPEEPATKFRFTFARDVVRVPVVPGLDPEVFAKVPVRGVLLEGFGTGNVPTAEGWVARIEAWRRQGVLVVLGSQCVDGPVDPSLYRSGQRALDAGAVSIGDMTPEAALVKLMWCLGNDLPFTAPIAGEGGPSTG
jgi:L-asparaginase/Glu-tRNA(Gln) amidotransferase subunit D